MGDTAAHRPIAGIERHLIGVAPAPLLARLEGFDDRVTGQPEMSTGVLVRGVIAAPHMPAGHAEAQVHPPRPDPQTLLAAVGAGGDHPDLIKVAAGRDHRTQRTSY